jgi:hypothetical protein
VTAEYSSHSHITNVKMIEGARMSVEETAIGHSRD